MALAKRGEQGEAGGGGDMLVPRALGRGLDGRAVGDGVGEGDADFEHVGAAFDERVEDRGAGLQIGIAEHDEAAERAFALVAEPREHRAVAVVARVHSANPSSFCACSISLSPRPERLTSSTVSSVA